MKIKTSILGSTGSIGSTTLDIIDKKPSYFSINLLSAKKNIRLIIHQIRKYKPKIFVVTDQKIYLKIKKKFKKSKTKILNRFEKKKSFIF